MELISLNRKERLRRKRLDRVQQLIIAQGDSRLLQEKRLTYDLKQRPIIIISLGK